MSKNKYKIGIISFDSKPYEFANASTRLRCYDIIEGFKGDTEFEVSLYTLTKKYDIVIFQKHFNRRARILAKILKLFNTKIIFDINVNYLGEDNNKDIYVNMKHKISIIKMFDISDYILTSSYALKDIYTPHHNLIDCIEENINNDFFQYKKKHTGSSNLSILYCGYAAKAKEVYLIKDALIRLHEEFGIKLLFITDSDPEINFIPYKYIKYNQHNLPELLIQGDIKIAPRDLTYSYNLGHSFTKVAYPMSVGIPAVASPVPSYINREVLICNTDEEWYNTLKSLIINPELRNNIGNKAQMYVYNNFSLGNIIKQYKELFNRIVIK